MGMPRHRTFFFSLVPVLLAATAAGCGGATRVVHAPVSKVSFTESGGWSVMASGPHGVTLRFVPNTTLGLGIVLRNRSAGDVTLLDVEAPSAPTGLVHQIGTVLASWNPPPCPATRSCPALGFLHQPFESAKPSAVELAPNGEAAVQLNFRMRGCDAVPFATAGAPDRIDVTYRVGGGATSSEELPLGDAALDLRMPSRRDCLRRPKSTIAVDGPYATGSGWTIPTSSGDDCTRTAAGSVVFASRVFLAPQKPPVRIWIRLPRFRGIGLYRSLGTPAPALGPARVTAVVGIGIHGWQHFRSSSAVVDVRKKSPHTLSGRFRATIVGYRHSTFRAYGGWGCELRSQ